jgi:hypothetical protein
MSAHARQFVSPASAPVRMPFVPKHEVGGLVGEMHRELADRLAPQPQTALPAQALPFDEKLVQLSSRVLGYGLLAAGFVATGWLIF